MKKIFILLVILLLLMNNVALCECDCQDDCAASIDSIIATVNDFNSIKVSIGSFEKTYKQIDGLDWEISEIPLACQDKNIEILIKNGAGVKIKDSTIELVAGKNEIVVDYVSDNDKKVNFTITINYICPTATPTGTPTNTPTATSTNGTPTNQGTPTNTPLLTPTPTISITATLNSEKPNDSDNSELPKTGESENIIVLIISIMFIILGFVLFFSRRHTQE